MASVAPEQGSSPQNAPSPPLHGGLARGCRLPYGSALALILLSSLACRLAGLRSTEIWRDEAMTLIHARAGVSDLLLRLPLVEDTPPANYLLFKAWGLLGGSELWMRLLPVLLGVAAVAVLMRTAGRIRPGAEWSTGLLAAFSYQLVYYSQEVRVYSLLVLITALCLWCVQRFVSSNGTLRNPLWCGFLGALASHCHAVGLFVFPMCIVYCLVQGGIRRAALRSWIWAADLWLILSAPMFWFSFHWSRQHAAEGNWWAGGLNCSSGAALLQGFLGLATARHWADTGGCTGMWLGFVIEHVIILAVMILVLAGVLGRERRSLLACAAATLTYCLLILISSASALPNVSDRTMLPAWLPVVVLLGTAASGFTSRAGAMLRWTSVACLALIWAMLWLWTAYAAPPRRPLSRDAMLWLQQRVQTEDLIVSGSYGYEDILVYHLDGAIAGEQLVSPGIPVYYGLPPLHSMIHRSPDPGWADRLRSRLRELPRSANVWVVRYGWPPSPGQGDIENILSPQRQPADNYVEPQPLSTSVVRYVSSAPAP